MNEGRIWLYVSPSVGIPLLFVGFVAASLLVHASILTNTTWFADFWQGSAPEHAHNAAAAAAAPAMEAAPAEAAPAEAAPAEAAK
jgi:light-harvesting protein B-800-850 alpha chain